MAYIFHIIERDFWHKEKAQEGDYSPPSLNTDKFIHCAKADQILEILNSMFKKQTGKHFILLKIDENKVLPEIKSEAPFEFPMSQVLYPHIYGPLNKDSIENEIDLPCRPDGSYQLPKIL